ncbi:uncharacterized protein LOC129302079 [Prosopis cineraria]|uniref:uncharacterized protein LOC129302079 n=1 Tax=Prosopis cineraria TaxID=364024 RepID=UPI0024100949|nr:uncharacterized protein LOC129302079 [Prosopis cineraria]
MAEEEDLLRADSQANGIVLRVCFKGLNLANTRFPYLNLHGEPAPPDYFLFPVKNSPRISTTITMFITTVMPLDLNNSLRKTASAPVSSVIMVRDDRARGKNEGRGEPVAMYGRRSKEDGRWFQGQRRRRRH